MPPIGSVTIPLFHCVFNDGGSVTHWCTTYERDLYDGLPHLYLVCLADNSVFPRQIRGAFMVKTSSHHDHAGFADAMHTASFQLTTLKPLLGPETSFLATRIGIQGDPPGEMDFLRLAMQQYTKFSAAGRA